MKATYVDAMDALSKLTSAGYQAYLAGGCVRDIILGVQPNDYDVTTSAKPEEVQRVLGYSIPVGASFGVTKVIYGENRELDVATFRTDGAYSDNRRPDSVEYTESVEEDVARRDFTINALLMDKNEVIHDYVFGQNDLRNRILRTVGNPNDRFAEDSLRMIRAIRFASKYNLRIHADTWKAITELAPTIKNVSTERVTDELTKMFASTDSYRGFFLLHHSGLWINWFDNSLDADDKWRTMKSLHDMDPTEPFVMALALILCEASNSVKESILNKLTLTSKQRRDFASLLEHSANLCDFLHVQLHEKRKMMQWEDKDLAMRFINTQRTSYKYTWNLRTDESLGQIYEEMDRIIALGWPTPLINGNNLQDMGFIAGPVFTEMLDMIRAQQLDGKLTGNDDIKDFLINQFPAAPRKNEDGTVTDGMSFHRVAAQCSHCKRSMSFEVQADSRGRRRFSTARDALNISSSITGHGTYIECGNCHTRRRKDGFVRIKV